MREVQRFWMVFVSGRKTPARVWINRTDAENEAKRLAVQERRNAFVLEAVAGYAVPDPIELTIIEEQPE